MSTKIDLDDLERKARAATPGPWKACGNGAPCPCRLIWSVLADDVVCRVAADEELGTQEDVNHIAASSPPVMLALIARIRELEKAYREIMDDNFSDLDTISERELLDKGAVLP